MNRISGTWINTPPAKRVCGAVLDAGYQIFFVGGCVRNDLLGMPITDLDLATNAQPEQVIKAAKQAGLRSIPTGISHGTVTIIVDQEPFEITTFRKDVETDGRRAVVVFADNLTDDARRRDFTMNALYATADGVVIDPLGGLADLRAGRVRFIDDANMRICEDHLRSLRFFRFNAWYGDPQAGLDPDGLAAIASNLDGLGGLSKERVGAETLKLLSASDPSVAVAAMERTGVLARILPGATAAFLPALTYVEQSHGPSALRRLAMLGGEDVAKNLRLSRRMASYLAILRNEMAEATPLGALAYRHDAQVATDVALLRAAQHNLLPDADVWAEIATGSKASFPIRPTDLMPDFADAALGNELRRLEQLWINSGFTLTREALLS